MHSRQTLTSHYNLTSWVGGHHKLNSGWGHNVKSSVQKSMRLMQYKFLKAGTQSPGGSHFKCKVKKPGMQTGLHFWQLTWQQHLLFVHHNSNYTWPAHYQAFYKRSWLCTLLPQNFRLSHTTGSRSKKERTKTSRRYSRQDNSLAELARSKEKSTEVHRTY